MAERREHTGRSPSRLAEHPALAAFVLHLPSFGGRDVTKVEEGLENIGKAIRSSGRSFVFQLSLNEGGQLRHWSLAVSPEGYKVSKGHAERPTLEVIARSETWTKIAAGEIAPIEAFGGGGMRLRGDIGVARFLFSQLIGQRT